MLFHKPGWVLPNGHTVRSQMEASLCGELETAQVAHQHGTPETYSFEVAIAPHRRSLYVPCIVLTGLRHADRQVIIEPIDSARPGGGVRRLTGFRQAHLAGYFVIVVARRALHHQLPTSAYDLLAPLEDFGPLEDFVQSHR